jgi:hypothetical protein
MTDNNKYNEVEVAADGKIKNNKAIDVKKEIANKAVIVKELAEKVIITKEIAKVPEVAASNPIVTEAIKVTEEIAESFIIPAEPATELKVADLKVAEPVVENSIVQQEIIENITKPSSGGIFGMFTWFFSGLYSSPSSTQINSPQQSYITPDETSNAVVAEQNQQVAIDLSCTSNSLMSGECKQDREAEQLLL